MAVSNTLTAVPRRLAVKHITRYRYNQPIQHSKHCVHLRPIDDVHQRVATYRLPIVPDVPIVEFEDVFGNWASRFEISQPYKELTLTAESTVTLSDVDPVRLRSLADPPFVSAGLDAVGAHDAVPRI